MQELSFEITGINKERKINGNTYMRLMCVQDSVLVDIVIPNSESNNKDLIRQKAIEQHDKYVEARNNKIIVDIGTII